MSPFNCKGFSTFNDYLAKNEYEHFCVLKHKETGKYFFHGNYEMGQEFCTNKNKEIRRNSRDWVPESEIKMSKSLDEILNNLKEVRHFSSYLLHHFLGKKQKLGQVFNIMFKLYIKHF